MTTATLLECLLSNPASLFQYGIYSIEFTPFCINVQGKFAEAYGLLTPRNYDSLKLGHSDKRDGTQYWKTEIATGNETYPWIKITMVKDRDYLDMIASLEEERNIKASGHFI